VGADGERFDAARAIVLREFEPGIYGLGP